MHPLLAEAKRQAEKLYRYRIKRHGSAAILWRFDEDWRIAGVYPSTEAAESYLEAKLPAIESDM